MIRFLLLSLVVGFFTLTGNAYAADCTCSSEGNPTVTPATSPVVTPVPSPAVTPVTSSNSAISTIEQSVYNQINQYRASQGLPALTRNSSLDNQARIHSANMANGSVAFGHDGFTTRLSNSGLSYSSAAENVSYNAGYSDPATIAVNGWLKSPGHLANIRGNFTLTGIGVAKNSKNEYYLTQLFLKQ